MHVDLTGSWEDAASAYRASRDFPNDQLPSGLATSAIDTLLAIRQKARSAVEDPEGAGKLPGPSLEQAAKLAGVELPVLLRPGQDATDLLEALKEGAVSASDLLEKALARAILTDAALGCITEFAAEAARERARELDDLQRSGQPLGALHGLPISIKAHVGLKGVGTDRGFVFDVLSPQSVERLLAEGSPARSKFPPAVIRQLAAQGPHLAPEDAWIAATLASAGAIIFAKTTMPQSVMQLDTRSNLHGQTLNPVNLHLSPGGSSGGESALLGARAAALGVGTDIGGSIRQPAACTGVYGIRPTTGRLSMSGIRGTMKGNEGILGTCGPFAHSLRDLQTIMSVLCAPGPTGSWVADSFACPPLPWRSIEASQQPLKVGVMTHDGVVATVGPVARSLENVVQKLKASGEVEVVQYDPGNLHREAWDLARELYFTENGALIRALAESTGEPLLPLTAYILESPVRDHSASEMWELNARREAFKRRWLAHWRSLGIDVLLCPTSAGVAPRPGKIHYWGYTSFFNLVDHPGVVFPTGVHAESAQDGPEPSSAPLSDIDRQHRAEYYGHQAAFDNAPVGLQLIGARWQEEELLAAAATIERIAGKA